MAISQVINITNNTSLEVSRIFTVVTDGGYSLVYDTKFDKETTLVNGVLTLDIPFGSETVEVLLQIYLGNTNGGYVCYKEIEIVPEYVPCLDSSLKSNEGFIVDEDGNNIIDELGNCLKYIE